MNAGSARPRRIAWDADAGYSPPAGNPMRGAVRVVLRPLSKASQGSDAIPGMQNVAFRL
ncbi:MAG: hypothetical protein KDA76_01075 [Planctomycetaceae bacterium]|nr:hypothetical protein [Planctomycetaceae bacterium]